MGFSLTGLPWAALAVSRRIIFVPFGSMPLDLVGTTHRLMGKIVHSGFTGFLCFSITFWQFNVAIENGHV